MKRWNDVAVKAVTGAVLLVALLATACRGQERGDADLQRMTDELLPRLEALSGLQAREPIRFARQSREEMQAFVEKQLEEEMPPEELAGMQAAYAAFGLIPDTLDLRRLLHDLYSEQVVGYYDPVTDALYIVEGASGGDVYTVLAHELVHALQDQHVDLDSLIAKERGNDRQTAAQAAIEGHATAVMFAILMEQQLGAPVNPELLPDLGAQLQPLLEAQNSQFPVFRQAPRIIRETLLFPYVGGASFVQSLWRQESKMVAPFDSLLPHSTEQVLDPVERFLGDRDEPTEIGLAETTGGWRTLYENTLGKLEVEILLREHLGSGADVAAEGWDGDRYRLIEAPDGGRALIWYSVWDDAAAADRFADAYRRVLDGRPGRQGRVERLEIEGRSAVLVVDADQATPLADVPIPAVTGIREG